MLWDSVCYMYMWNLLYPGVIKSLLSLFISTEIHNLYQGIEEEYRSPFLHVLRVIKLIFTGRIKVYMAGDSWVTETASEVNGHMSQSGLTRLLYELLGLGILFVLCFVILWMVPVVSKNYQRLSSVLSCLENKQHLRWTHNLVCSSLNIGISQRQHRDGS